MGMECKDFFQLSQEGFDKQMKCRTWILQFVVLEHSRMKNPKHTNFHGCLGRRLHDEDISTSSRKIRWIFTAQKRERERERENE
jgi:hypothetical protein